MPRIFRGFAVPLFAALALAPVNRADAQSISLGLMAGMSQSKFTGDALEDARTAGFIAGGFVRLSAMGFAVQPGLYYTAKGAKTEDFSETTGQGSRTKLGYIQIPIVVRIAVGPLYVGAGPAIGLNLSCTQSVAGGESADCGDAFGAKSTELSGILEAGVTFGKFSLGGRADIGISNWREAISGGTTTNLNYKTQTVSIVAAIRI